MSVNNRYQTKKAINAYSMVGFMKNLFKHVSAKRNMKMKGKSKNGMK